jgi:hypothetical protein
VINTTNAVKRATRRGFKPPECTPPPPKIVYVPAPAPAQSSETYTKKQVDEIVNKVLRK